MARRVLEQSPLAADEPLARLVDAPPDYPFPNTTDRLLPWSHTVQRLRDARHYWLATTRPDSRPHVTPLWGVWLDSALYFHGAPTAHWARNLTTNPFASVHLESGEDVVVVEGVVEELVTDARLAARIVEGWDDKYGRHLPEADADSVRPNPATRGVWRLEPASARAWSEGLQNGTRWRFADG